MVDESAVGERLAEAIGDPRAVPDLAWAAALSDRSVAEVGRILGELRAQLPLEEEVARLHRSAGRESYAQIRAPFELYILTRLARPEAIVETGVSSGVSSLHFLLGLEHNRQGRLYSIDLPTRTGTSPVRLPSGRSSGWVVPEQVRSRWELHLGPSEALLPEIVAKLPRVDLFLHDSRHTPEHLAFELNAIRSRLVPGSIVIADNTEWTGDSFERFAHSVNAPVLARGGSDLKGLRIPSGPARREPARAPRPAPTTRKPARRKVRGRTVRRSA